MKKSLIAVLVAIGLFILWSISSYNGLVTLDENVKAKWANVENQYQKRIDLVPNLVATVKAAAASEQEILTGVTEARASATKMDVNLQDAQEMAEFQQNQTGLSQALGRLLMVTENYPVVQSNQNFLGLQTQLEGVENRIATERGRYNEAVQQYNGKVRSFPTNIGAMIMGFDRYEEFKGEAGSAQAPDLTEAF